MYNLHHVLRLWVILVYVFSWINGFAQAQPRLHFLREPERQLYIEPGKINQLDCSYEDDSGNVHQSWLFNDQLINHELTNVLPNGTLRFEIYEDATSSQRDRLKGLYRCCISADSLTLCSIASNVSFPSIGPPEVITSTTSAHIGDVLRLACHVQADPAGRITWFKDDANIPFDETRLVLLPTDVIQITEVVEADQGLYKCVAENLAGTIISPGMAISVSPELSTAESHASRGEILNQTVAEVYGVVGGDVILECFVRQANRVDIYWTNGSTSVPEDRRQFLGYGNILLKNLTLNDTGNYTCTSVDKRSQRVRSTRVKLTVQSPPLLVVPESMVSRREALTVSLKCHFSGIPEPEFVWYHNGERVKSVGRHSYTHSSDLYIYNIGYDDAGLYQCFAWNHLGNVYGTTLVNVTRSVVESVNDLHITDITSTTAIARWSRPDFTSSNGTVKAFVLYYSKLPDGIELSDPIPATEDHWILDGLHPDSNYSVSVRAVTDDNLLSLLETVYMKTREDVPSSAPRIINVTSTSTTVTVQWLPLRKEDCNGVLTYQEVCVEQEPSEVLECKKLDPFETSYTFENLVPGVEYLTYVLAATSVGKGVESDKYPRITPIGFNCSVPDHVPIQHKILNTTFIMFTWPAANGTQRELIRGYRLVISIVKTNRRVDFLLLDANTVGYNKTNAGFDTYSVTFYAIGECGQGPASTTVVTMPEEVTVDVRLLSPYNIETETLSVDRIKVSWRRPTTQERVESYTIGYSAIGQPEDLEQGIQPDHFSPRMEHVLTGLQTDTFYRIRVMANYEDGTSNPSIYVHGKTEEDKPGSAPTNVHAYVLDSTSINITWKPPLIPNGVIISYTINYWSSNDVRAGWKQVEKPVDEDNSLTLSLVLRNLEPNTEYTFNIRAATKVGKGPQTRLYNVSTKTADTGLSNPSKHADLRKGILTGVCLALLSIIVCVSLLLYHLRRNICRQQDQHCRSVATRTSTPGHHKGCHHRSRKWREPQEPEYSLSVLQTEFEMEHLMMKERSPCVSERLMIQVHHVDNNFPSREASSGNQGEEAFVESSHLEHHHTSQETPTPDAEPPVIPHKDTSSLQSLPQCAPCTLRESTSCMSVENLSGEGNVAAARRGQSPSSIRSSHSPALTHHNSNTRNAPVSNKCPHCQPHKSYLYSDETLPRSATSELCRHEGPMLSIPLHYSGQSQEEDPSYCHGACEEKYRTGDESLGGKLQAGLSIDGQVFPEVDDQQSEISSNGRDSGLDGESAEEVMRTQDTSPNFLERVLEELSVAE